MNVHTSAPITPSCNSLKSTPLIFAASLIVTSSLALAVLCIPSIGSIASSYPSQIFWSGFAITVLPTSAVLTLFIQILINKCQKHPESLIDTPQSSDNHAPDPGSDPITQFPSTPSPPPPAIQDLGEPLGPPPLIVDAYEGKENFNELLLSPDEGLQEVSATSCVPPLEGMTLGASPAEVQWAVMDQLDTASLIALSYTCKQMHTLCKAKLKTDGPHKARLLRGAISCWQKELLAQEEVRGWDLQKDFMRMVQNLTSYHPFMLSQIEALLPHLDALPHKNTVLWKIAATLHGIFLVQPRLISSDLIADLQQRAAHMQDHVAPGSTIHALFLKRPCTDLASALSLARNGHHPGLTQEISYFLWEDLQETLAQIDQLGAGYQENPVRILLIHSKERSPSEKRTLIDYTLNLLSQIPNSSPEWGDRLLETMSLHLVPLYISLGEITMALALIDKVRPRSVGKLGECISSYFNENTKDEFLTVLFEKLLPHLSSYKMRDEIKALTRIFCYMSCKEQARQMLLKLPTCYFSGSGIALWTRYCAHVNFFKTYKFVKTLTSPQEKMAGLYALSTLFPKLSSKSQMFQEIFVTIFEAQFAYCEEQWTAGNMVEMHTIQCVIETAKHYATINPEPVIAFLEKALETHIAYLEKLTTTSAFQFAEKIKPHFLVCRLLLALAKDSRSERKVADCFKLLKRKFEEFIRNKKALERDVFGGTIKSVAKFIELCAPIEPQEAYDFFKKTVETYSKKVHGEDIFLFLMRAGLVINTEKPFDFSTLLNQISVAQRGRLLSEIDLVAPQSHLQPKEKFYLMDDLEGQNPSYV